jgi:hypothetical protein
MVCRCDLVRNNSITMTDYSTVNVKGPRRSESLALTEMMGKTHSNVLYCQYSIYLIHSPLHRVKLSQSPRFSCLVLFTPQLRHYKRRGNGLLDHKAQQEQDHPR